MSRKIVPAVSLVVVASLAGCGGSSKSAATVDSVAEQLACPKPIKADVIGTTAALDCGDAKGLRIESFQDTKTRDELVKSLADTGLVGPLVYVGDVVIECPDEATAKSVASKVGGEVITR